MSEKNKNIDKSEKTLSKADKWMILAERLIRNKPGTPRKYDYDTLLKEFHEYVDFYRQHKTVYQQKSKQRKGGSGDEVQAERVERYSPMTELSFCAWLGVDKLWLSKAVCNLEKRKDTLSPEDAKYLELLHALRTYLNTQLLEGAVVGEYTPSVVISLLGLKKQFDVTTAGQSLNAPVINIIPDTATREQYESGDDD